MALLASLSATLFVGLGIFFVNYRLNRPDRTIEATRELMQLQEEIDRLSLEEDPAERSKLIDKQDRMENEIFAERRQETSIWISWVGLLTCGVIVPFSRPSYFVRKQRKNYRNTNNDRIFNAVGSRTSNLDCR